MNAAPPARRRRRNCCERCFRHHWVRQQISTSEAMGDCDFCPARNVRIVDVQRLYSPFSNLMTMYARADDEVPILRSSWDVGEYATTLIEEDWEVFSQRHVRDGTDAPLLSEILRSGWDDDSGELPFDRRELYVRQGRFSRLDPIESWELFRTEVLEDSDAELELPASFDFYLERIGRMITAGERFHRAVLGWERENGEERVPWKVGPPPEGMRIGPGRANREGQRVLYCTEDEPTAIAEVRPARGNLVSVGTLQTTADKDIVDLGDNLPIPNPFTTESLSYQLEEIGLLNGFSEELSQPLRRNDDPRQYLPSQRLCEYIRESGYSGIRYPSAMRPGGKSLVFFDFAGIEVRESRLVEVTNLTFTYKDHRFS